MTYPPGAPGERPGQQPFPPVDPATGAIDYPETGYAPTPPPGYPPPWGYPPPGYGPPKPKTNTMATSSLVVSLVGLVLGIPLMLLCFVGVAIPLVGLILGIVALNQIKTSGEDGRGMALAGVIIGGIGMIPVVAMVVMYGAYGLSIFS
jgi:hypothetical protein